MDRLNPEFSVPVKKRKLSVEVVCFLCGTKSTEALLLNPADSSYEKLVTCILNRSVWGDEKCSAIKRSFGDDNFSTNNLKSKNVKWHRSCYQLLTHKQVCEKLRKNYSESSQEPGPFEQESSSVLTRGKAPIYDKSKCFFCDEGNLYREKLSKVVTDNAGLNLSKAVQLNTNDIYRVRLNAACNPSDAHAIDVMYHPKCWATNVTNVLRKQKVIEDGIQVGPDIAHTVAEIEFIGALSEALADGKVFSMSTLEETYKSVCHVNGVSEDVIMSRKQIKKLIEIELSEKGVEFSRSKRANETQRVSMKCTRDALLVEAESEGEKMNRELSILYQAANIVRQEIMNSKNWVFDGSFPTDLVPNAVKTFFKWCIKGKCDISDMREVKHTDIEKKTDVLSQLLISSCLSDRQLKNKTSTTFHSQREMPLQVAVGLTVHGTTRSKTMVERFHGLGFSIDYPRVLRLETQIASSVLENMKVNSGIYIPPDVIYGRFIHCAADNLDFSEDTPDGKRTLHGTVMTIYQIKGQNDRMERLSLKPSNARSLENANDAVPSMVPFQKPSNWASCCPESKSYSEQIRDRSAVQAAELSNFAWILIRKKCITAEDPVELKENSECSTTPATTSPTWTGYMALLAETKPVAKVSMLPLIAESPTQHSVQLTFMKQFEKINSLILGPNNKVVVTVDLALYKPLKQLEMAIQDCQKKWVLKPGELHIIIAQLRTIGDFITESGIPELWIESNMYGASTARQIIEGKHVRRGLQAHITTTSSLMMLLLEEFCTENPTVIEDIAPQVANVASAFTKGEVADVREQHLKLVSTLEDKGILQKLHQFCDRRGSNEPVFKFACTYMDMVESMLMFVKSVRSSDFSLSLASLKIFLKYFFAMDRHNYARMITLYLSEMDELQETAPLIWNEFISGNWVVNQSVKPFCALGDDEALEHQNRRLKVQGGLTGITLNDSCRVKFFLTDAELTRIAEDTNTLYGRSTTNSKEHHRSSLQVRNRLDQHVILLKKAFESTTNPFACRNTHLVQLVTQRVFPQDIEHDVGKVKEAGEELRSKFVKERIETHSIPFWSRLNKLKLKTCKSAARKVKVDLKGKVIEMRSNVSLFSKLVIASRSRPDVDMKLCLSEYELSAVPRSLFAPDGSMHHCLAKYKLAQILENLPKKTITNTENTHSSEPEPIIAISSSDSNIVAIVDGMAQLHAVHKPASVKTCHDFGQFFSQFIDQKYNGYTEVHLIFDYYKEGSLKTGIRDHRQITGRTQYKILPTTNISNTTMRKLLSHEKTKDELTTFLAEHFITYGKEHKKKFIVSWQEKTAATHTDVTMLESSQEEADTKIILHGAYVAQKGIKTLHIYSPDSDVMILAIARYALLPQDTGIYFGHGMKRFISLRPIYNALGPLKASALPGLHSLSGCDTTGSFVNKGKLTWWKAFQCATTDVVECLANLGTSPDISAETRAILEKFICQVYIPNTLIVDIGEARWWLFTKKQFYDERLPPTREALQPAIERANLQAMIWHQDLTQYPVLPSPEEHGWKKVEDKFEPIMCTKPCAPSFLLEVSRCGCKQKRCNQSCICVVNKLRCTEMCQCNGDPELCDNVGSLTDDEDDEETFFQSDDDDDSVDHNDYSSF